jgi:hypothetical protein
MIREGLHCWAVSLGESSQLLSAEACWHCTDSNPAMCFGIHVCSQMLQLSFTHGLAKYTAEAFANVGAYMSSCGEIREGTRFGRIAEKLLKQSCDRQGEVTGRAFACIASCTKWWAEPIPLSFDLFISGNEFCMRAGSISYACHCHVMYSISFFYSGLPLEPLLRDVENFCSLFLEYRQYSVFQMLTPLWQCLLNLTGNSSEPRNMEAGLAYEQWKLVSSKGKSFGQQVVVSYWMQIAFYFGDIEKATELSKQLKQEFSGLTKAMVFYPARLFFFTLIAMANYRKSQQRKYKVEAQKNIKIFRTLVSAGAMSIVHKLQLLEAELLSLSPKECIAIICKKYDDSIVSARRAGFLQDAALANYLCFELCQRRNHVTSVSANYLTQSRALWTMWNATAVADSLIDRHPAFLGDSAALTISCGSFRSRQVFNSSLTKQHKFLPV